MANIIKTIIAKQIENRGDNKAFPCKTYATEAAAEKVAAEMAEKVRAHFCPDDERECGYLVIYMEAWGRWVCAINMSEVVQRRTAQGGYLGICAAAGHYSF